MGRTEQRLPADEQSASSDGLVWPAPVEDTDILWLHTEADKTDTARGPHAEAHPAEAAPVPTSGPTGLAVSQLLAGGVSIEWHDTVAIVSQLAESVVPDKARPPVGAVPSVDDIWLEPDGRVHAALDRSTQEPLVAGFGRVLQALLHDGPAPANLRLLIWRAKSEAGAALSLDELIVELARWERPGRVGKLVNLYERARAAASAPAVSTPAPVDISAPALEPRDAEPPQPASEPPPRDSEPSIVPRRSARQIAIVVAAVIACMVAASATTWWVARLGDASATGPVVTFVAASDIELPKSGARRSLPLSRAEAARTAPRSRSEHSAVQNSGRVTPSVAQSKVMRQSARDTPAVVTPSPTPTRPNAPEADLHATADTRLYRSGDEAVTAPVLVKPRLPLQPRPEIPASALGVLELVVDASGHVESVHLKSPVNRYREKWWLFAAKDWQFEPARKQGRPVRFLERILLTDLNMSEPQ